MSSPAQYTPSVVWVRVRQISRLTAAVIGGYAFAYGFAALATLVGFGAGLRFFEAQSLVWLLSLPVYLGAILWGFAARSATRVWLMLGVGGAVMMAAAWALSRAML